MRDLDDNQTVLFILQKEVSKKKKKKEKRNPQRRKETETAKVASDGLSVRALKKGCFVRFTASTVSKATTVSKRQPFLPYTQSSSSSSSFEASKPQGLTAKPTLLFPFFLLFFLQVAIERGGKGVKKTSLPRYYASLEEEEARPSSPS